MEASASQLERCAARVGQVIRGKWRLMRLIDVGGMSAVYAATHRNGNRVAIKMLHPEVAVLPDLRERFLKEGYVANRVEHPGAVRVQDDDQAEDGCAFIVMELLDGETLHTRIERHGGRLPAEDVLRIVDKVLEVLAAAHERQILHRDVKPSNIFITQGAEVKLLDFGIARIKQAGFQTYTLPGLVLGTPGFVPPEQALGRSAEIDPRSDLWAVGATMFTAIAGRVVHLAETPNEQVVLAATQPAPSLAGVAPDVPRAVVDVVDRALQFHKDHRFGSANEMRTAIHEAFHRLHGDRLSRGSQTVPMGPKPADAREMPPTVMAFPSAPQTTPHGVVAPQTDPHPTTSLTPFVSSYRNIWLAAAGFVLVMSALLWIVLRRPTPDDGPPVLAFTAEPALVPDPPPSTPVPETPTSKSEPSSAPVSPAGLPEPGPGGATPGPPPTPTLPSPSSAQSTSAAAEKGTGTLNINSIPVSRVVLDGRPLGTTPKIGISVPPGQHTITFVHPEKGKKSVTVTVRAGETKTAVTKF